MARYCCPDCNGNGCAHCRHTGWQRDPRIAHLDAGSLADDQLVATIRDLIDVQRQGWTLTDQQIVSAVYLPMAGRVTLKWEKKALPDLSLVHCANAGAMQYLITDQMDGILKSTKPEKDEPPTLVVSRYHLELHGGEPYHKGFILIGEYRSISAAQEAAFGHHLDQWRSSLGYPIKAS